MHLKMLVSASALAGLVTPALRGQGPATDALRDMRALGALLGEPPPGVEVTFNRGQAMPKGALDAVRGSRSGRRRELRQVTRELAGAQGIVLGHIHPRWLRAEVEAKLDAGEDVDEAWLNARRAQGRG